MTDFWLTVVRAMKAHQIVPLLACTFTHESQCLSNIVLVELKHLIEDHE